MRRTIYKIYTVLGVVCLLVVWYMWNNFNLYVTSRQYEHGYQVVKDYEFAQYEDPSAPAGIRDEYLFRFDRITGAYRELVFFTVHQDVDIFIDGVRVYHMQPAKENAFGRTPGCVWNSVALKEDEAGHTVQVVIYPVYTSLRGVAPTFYYGEKYTIVLDVLFRQLPTLAICAVCMLMGIIFAGYEVYHHRGAKIDSSMIMLGCFAVLISLWKITDNEATYLLLPHKQALYMMPYMMLHLAQVPFVFFVRDLNIGGRERRIWEIPVFASFIGAGASILLQLLRIFDMRQMLWVVHLEILLTSVVTFGMLFYEIRRRGLTGKLRVHAVALSVCAVGMLSDLVAYYLTDGMKGTFFAVLGFTVYIGVLGAYSLRNTKALISIGEKAVQFEEKAYHDQLTGLNNRTAYADYTNREDFSPQRCIIAVFDLNNLKKCNDILGHEKGDIYIKECARIIQDTFGDIGHCYRMGGDEFCAILENISLETCQKRMQQMNKAVEERNRRNPEIKMGIAYGYEMFDGRIDYNLNDTSRRADKKMYARKFEMKQEESR